MHETTYPSYVFIVKCALLPLNQLQDMKKSFSLDILSNVKQLF